MSSRTEALRLAETLANALQQARTDTEQRWQWRQNAGWLELVAREEEIHDVKNLSADLLACGEVAHLVRTTMIEDGWEVRTRITDTAQTRTALTSLEITGPRSTEGGDDLFAAITEDPSDGDGHDAGSVDAGTVAILLQDAAVEHGARLTTVKEDTSVVDQRMARQQGVPWRVVSPGDVPDDRITTAVLSTIGEGVEAQFRTGVASAEVQLTAASMGFEAVPMTDLDSVPCVPVEEHEQVQVTFRIGRVHDRHRGARLRERTTDGKQDRILHPGPPTRRLGGWAKLPAARTASP